MPIDWDNVIDVFRDNERNDYHKTRADKYWTLIAIIQDKHPEEFDLYFRCQSLDPIEAHKVVVTFWRRTQYHPFEFYIPGNLLAVHGYGAVKSCVLEGIEKSPKAWLDYCKGKEVAKGAIIGYCMKEYKGILEPHMVDEVIQDLKKEKLKEVAEATI